MSHDQNASKSAIPSFWMGLLLVAINWIPLLMGLVYRWLSAIPFGGLMVQIVMSCVVSSCLTALVLLNRRAFEQETASDSADSAAADSPAVPRLPLDATLLLRRLQSQFEQTNDPAIICELLHRLEELLPQLSSEAQCELCLKLLQTYLHSTASTEENTASSVDSQQLFHTVRDMISSRCQPETEGSAGTEIQAVLLDYVDKNCLDSSLCLNSAADHLNTSIYAVSRIFKDATGVGFKEYITGKRLQYACQLLETTRKTISTVAAESGFENSTYFTTVFKNEYGIPPSKYRAKAQHRSESEESEDLLKT